MGVHSFPPNAFSREQCYQFAESGQHEPKVHGYRSFVALGEGKAVCILDADSREDVAEYFRRMGMPTDSISELELEGERGNMRELTPATAHA
jgi:hypothetical protein